MKMDIQKFGYFENEKSFLDEKKNKTFFIVFEGISFGEKKKKIDRKQRTQANNTTLLSNSLQKSLH